jgi:hypothetical protein
MTDLADNGTTEHLEGSAPADRYTAVEYAAKMLTELKPLGPADRLTAFDLIREALEDHWSTRQTPGNLRAYKLAHKINDTCPSARLAQHTLTAVGRLLPAADRVSSKTDVRAALDVQRQLLDLAAESTRAQAGAARATRKPKTRKRTTGPRPAAVEHEANTGDPDPALFAGDHDGAHYPAPFGAADAVPEAD